MAYGYRRHGQCRYCSKVANTTAIGDEGPHGYGCQYSPNGLHKEIGDADHCINCGSTNYGFGCNFNPDDPQHRHEHGHGVSDRDGQVHCIWCGSSNTSGYGCPYSPSGKHEA